MVVLFKALGSFAWPLPFIPDSFMKDKDQWFSKISLRQMNYIRGPYLQRLLSLWHPEVIGQKLVCPVKSYFILTFSHFCIDVSS